MKATEFTWVQRNGTPILVKDMSDHHLLCTIRLLRRNSKQLADRENSLTASMVWDADDAKSAFWFEDDQFAEGHPTWEALQFERKRRNLEELPI